MADNLFAYTPPGGTYPEYASLNVRDGDLLALTVRAPPSYGVGCHVHEGATATIVIPEDEAYDLALGLLNWLASGARARLKVAQPVAAITEPATLAAGCCSSIRPCGHQCGSPDTVCHVCAQAGALGPRG